MTGRSTDRGVDVTSPTVAAAIGEVLGAGVVSMRPVHGGDVARAFRVRLDDGRHVFAKTHDDPPPGFFTTEATGLAWLAEPGAVPVPTVLGVTDDPVPLLVLEWVDVGVGVAPNEEAFGVALAALHAFGAPYFGREDRRPTGSRQLPNDPCDTWVEFYATCRLEPLARLARDTDALDPDTCDALVGIAGRLGEFGAADEPPARLHGDLWAGNRLVDRTGRSWLVDPAAHGGHREFDLAMMRLFGGFGTAAFDAYDAAFPLADGWENRVSLHQLAPLVVHAVKFGGSYRGATVAAVAGLR